MVSLLLRALTNPDSVTMDIKTADGSTVTLPCKVTKVNGKTRITADYMSLGKAVTSGTIYIGQRRFARARIDNGQKLYTAGPTQFGGDF
jgi:hypothetical protein